MLQALKRQPHTSRRAHTGAERFWGAEAIFGCLRCFAQIYIPFATFAWIPTRRRRPEMSALELASEWLAPGDH